VHQLVIKKTMIMKIVFTEDKLDETNP